MALDDPAWVENLAANANGVWSFGTDDPWRE